MTQIDGLYRWLGGVQRTRAWQSSEMQRLAEFELNAPACWLSGGSCVVLLAISALVNRPWSGGSISFLHGEAAKQYNGWLGLHEYSVPTMYYNSTADGEGRYPV